MKIILIRFWVFSLVFLLTVSSLLQAQTAADYGFVEGVNFKKNVVYKSVDGSNLVMDIYYPKAEKMKEHNPWMLFVHGGGWAGGSKDDILKASFLGTLQNIVDSGFVCASIYYRLAKSPVTSYESVVDSKDAAKFLLKNADLYKLDKELYGVWGGSAGGHLSLVTALVPDSFFPGDAMLADIHPQFKCVASFFPFTSCLNDDLRPGSIFEDGTLYSRLLGGTREEKPELARLLSPSEFLTDKSPSILLLHGEKDTTLPIINSLFLMQVAKDKNADVQLLTVKNAGHSFSGSNIAPSFEGIAESCSKFIFSHLKVKNNTGAETSSVKNIMANSIAALKLYPNPVSNTLNFEDADGAEVEIYNSTGKLLLKNKIVGTNYSIDVTAIDRGIYLAKLSKNGTTQLAKFIKN